MEKIPTAEEFFDSSNLRVSYDTEYQYCKRAVMEKAIEFAKLHVEAALKEASEKGEAFVRTNGEWTSSKVTAGLNKESILNSYPLEKIK